MGESLPTRQAIHDYLAENQHATSEQLSRALQVTQADIRYHIGILMKMGILEVISRRAKAGRGRPVRVYALVNTEQSNNALLLATTLLSSLPEDGREGILRRAALSMAGDDALAGRGLTQRLIMAVRRLNALNYRARWEAHKSSPRLIFLNCPYRNFVDEHPEMCTLDRFLLSHLLREDVIHTVKLGLNTKEERFCTFQVIIGGCDWMIKS